MDKVSYALGLNIGKQLSQMGAESLNIDDFAQAIKDVLAGNEQMTVAESQKAVNQFFQEAEAKQRAKAAEMGKAAKAEGEKYLADNAKKDGVITTKSGLQYMVITEGTGKSPKATDSVKCHYEGKVARHVSSFLTTSHTASQEQQALFLPMQRSFSM